MQRNLLKKTLCILSAAVLMLFPAVQWGHLWVEAAAVNDDITENIKTNIKDEKALSLLCDISAEASAGSNISVYYADTKTGYYFYYAPDKAYQSASTIKAVYCQYLLQSGTDLDEKIKFTYASKDSYSGRLSPSAVGSYFTVRELMEYSVIYSDNMAYRLLYEHFGEKGFNAYIDSLGLSSPKLYGSEYTRITARSLGKCMKEIYKYSEETGNYFLTDLMKRTEYNVQISMGTNAPVAHKYGYQGGTGGFHDAAIVYAEQPYVLVICSNIDGNSPDFNKPFISIASQTEQLHNELHSKNNKVQFMAKAAEDKILLKWESFGDADFYRVFIYDDEQGKFVKYKSVQKNSCVVKGLSEGTEYIFRVDAVIKENGKNKVCARSQEYSVMTDSYELTSDIDE